MGFLIIFLFEIIYICIVLLVYCQACANNLICYFVLHLIS
jgi:hypothetical protein